MKEKRWEGLLLGQLATWGKLVDHDLFTHTVTGSLQHLLQVSTSCLTHVSFFQNGLQSQAFFIASSHFAVLIFSYSVQTAFQSCYNISFFMPFSGLEYLGINDTVLLFLTLNATFTPLNILNIENNFFSDINYEALPHWAILAWW